MLEIKSFMQLNQEGFLQDEYATIENAILNFEFEIAEEGLRESHMPLSWKNELRDLMGTYRHRQARQEWAYDESINN